MPLKKVESLQNFIEALPHLEPLHYGFKLQGPSQSATCICSLAKGLFPWRRNHEIVADYSLCGIKHFQAHSLSQHCKSKSNEYHTATAFYHKKLFGASRKKGMPINRGIKHASVYHGKSVDDQSRKTADAYKPISI
jgi:hypothetical protein